MGRYRYSKSFTLLEFVVTVVIIAILAAVTFPVYNGAIWRARFVEVYNTVSVFARAEHAYYLENGAYPINPVAECYAGNGIDTGSTLIQQQLNVVIPSTHIFLYIIEPETDYPNSTYIYFKHPGYDWCYRYDYVTKTWSATGAANPGPACKYFQPPT
jgi:type II secretory pathway pseudopilin PulG